MEKAIEQEKEKLFDPFPKQIEFLEAVFSGRYDVILYGGAIRGGKTFAGLAGILWLCLKYSKSRWAVVRSSRQPLMVSTIPSFEKLCPKIFIDNYNKTTNIVTLVNGSQILFWGENYAKDKDLNRWRGLELNGCLLEEVNEIEYVSFIKAIERTGTHTIHPKPPGLILCTCNPTDNWVKEKFYDPWKAGTLHPRWKYIPSRITDNPYIMADKSYLERLKQMPKAFQEAFVEGNWDLCVQTGTEVYQEFDLDKHVKEGMEVNPELPLWISLDENFHPYFPSLACQVEGTTFRVMEEFCLRPPGNSPRDLADALKRRYPNHRGGFIITGDASSRRQDIKTEQGHDLFKLLDKALSNLYHVELKIPEINPNIYMRTLFINEIFYSNFNRIKIEIHPDCKELIRDLRNVKWNNDKTKHKPTKRNPDTGVSYQTLGHLSDCFDYAIARILRTDFREFQKGPAGTITMGKGNPKNAW